MKHLFLSILIAIAGTAQAVPDGSTKAKAIPLKQRDPMKAVEEEMVWMMKLYHYTPLLSTRDAVAESIPKMKAAKKSVNVPAPWLHNTLDHKGHLISYWWFVTPRGQKGIYFDTGKSIDTPGEVARQESARAHYMGEMARKLTVQ